MAQVTKLIAKLTFEPSFSLSLNDVCFAAVLYCLRNHPVAHLPTAVQVSRDGISTGKVIT